MIRIAARGSALSLAQVEIVRRLLGPRVQTELVTVRTTGDQLSHMDAAIEGKGVFTKEVDEALLEDRADVGVHSMKDLPSKLPRGLTLAVVPAREDPSDALISHPPRTFASLPRGGRVGTSSPRRRAQLLAARPDLEISDARGNVDTRVRRLQEGRWDAIVLARAGLVRLGRLHEISEVFSEELLLPAIGQGALALVIREGDEAAHRVIAPLANAAAHREARAERALLAILEAGCRAPLAGRATASDGRLRLVASVFSLSGDRSLREEGLGSADDPESLGEAVARKLLSRGAAELIAEARGWTFAVWAVASERSLVPSRRSLWAWRSPTRSAMRSCRSPRASMRSIGRRISPSLRARWRSAGSRRSAASSSDFEARWGEVGSPRWVGRPRRPS